MLRYLVKAIDIVEPYESAIRQIGAEDLDALVEFNQMMDQLLNGHLEYTDRRQQMAYMGNLDARSGDRCLMTA